MSPSPFQTAPSRQTRTLTCHLPWNDGTWERPPLVARDLSLGHEAADLWVGLSWVVDFVDQGS